ncbi:hypothetical protein, partial [Streptomyces sp. NPDC004546]|uniref:hypothetical protein n=1 Tax=Streptomyces sp. NPDC004546 TaxID=3154282 RepID=UPI00339F558B
MSVVTRQLARTHRSSRSRAQNGHDLGRANTVTRDAQAGGGAVDILAHLKEGDSRLPRRSRAWLRVGSCFIALC